MGYKKYEEINLNDKLFGKDYLVYKWDETETNIDIFIKSKKKIVRCECVKINCTN